MVASTRIAFTLPGLIGYKEYVSHSTLNIIGQHMVLMILSGHTAPDCCSKVLDMHAVIALCADGVFTVTWTV